MHIRDLAYGPDGGVKSPWRADLQPASYGKAVFHVEANSVENGRRIVMHEFPKKDIPYAEDMGRRAYELSVRGYCIQYPRDLDGAGMELYRRDYRTARDLLAIELSRGEPAPLRLPTLKGSEIIVVCPRYRMTEETRFGGFCTFDMTFVEQGMAPREAPPDARDNLLKSYGSLLGKIKDTLAAGGGTGGQGGGQSGEIA